MAARLAKRKRQQAEEELSDLSGLAAQALDSELQYITEQLRRNTPLAYTLASLIREDKLSSILQRRALRTSSSP